MTDVTIDPEREFPDVSRDELLDAVIMAISWGFKGEAIYGCQLLMDRFPTIADYVAKDDLES